MGARRGAEARRKQPRRRRPVDLDREKLGPLLSELMPIGGGAEPLSVLGHHDRAGNCRRITADYPNGWRLVVRLNTKLEVTSCSASICLRASAPPRENGHA